MMFYGVWPAANILYFPPFLREDFSTVMEGEHEVMRTMNILKVQQQIFDVNKYFKNGTFKN